MKLPRKDRFRRKGGRPQGSVIPLFDDPQRFTMVACWVLHNLGMGPNNAAHVATVLFDSAEPIRTADLDGLLSVASTDFVGRTASHLLRRHADRLVRRSSEFFKRANDEELQWMTESAGFAEGLIRFIVSGNQLGMVTSIRELQHRGWGEALDGLGKRLAVALSGDMAQFEGKQRKAGRDLLERGRAKNSEGTTG
jgi:hypothetical protein